MLIYGVGDAGEAALIQLRARGEKVYYFIDDRAEGTFCGLPIIHTTDLKPTFAVPDMIPICVSEGKFHTIKAQLKALGFNRVERILGD